MSCEGYLICGVDELDSFVGHGENDGRHFLHLFCRLLRVHRKKKRRDAAVTLEASQSGISCSIDLLTLHKKKNHS